MKFQIEYIAHEERPAYLFARKLEDGNFLLSENFRLGGVPVRLSTSPRSVTGDGRPDLMFFTFVLVTANDLPKLKVGQLVELSEALP